MNFTKPERIALELHPELNERWVQELIAADPSILGLAACSTRSRTHAAKGWQIGFAAAGPRYQVTL